MDDTEQDDWELRTFPGAKKNWFKLYGKYGGKELVARIYERGNRPGLEYVWQVGWLDTESGLLLDVVGSIYDFKSAKLMLSLAKRFCDQAQSAMLLECYDSLKE